MLKKILFYCLFLFRFFDCSAQSDAKYIKHWDKLPNSCIYFFNNEYFAGLFLDGNILKETDFFLMEKIKRITNFELDTLQTFKLRIDTSVVFNFEKSVRDILKENDSLLLSLPPYLGVEFYIRQYLGFCHENSQYLFVCFRLDEENLIMEKGLYLYKIKKSHELYKSVYSRILFSHSLDQWKRTNNLFYALYNINTNAIIFFLSCNIIDCTLQIPPCK
jgi:hypothetical protein